VRAEIPDTVPYAIDSDPVDPEEARYAPRPPQRFLLTRRLLAGVAVLGVVWMAVGAAYSWSQQQFYVGEQDGTVTIFRGIDADLPGVSLSSPYETTNVTLDRLSAYDASTVREGIDAENLADAHRAVDRLAANQSLPDEAADGAASEASESPTAEASSSPASETP
jgi:protein phosphatase